MSNPEQRYPVRFTKEQTPPDLALHAASIMPERITEVRLELTESEFATLGLTKPIAHFMYAVGKSYEEFPTTITSQDVVRAGNRATVQDEFIKSFLKRAGWCRPQTKSRPTP